MSEFDLQAMEKVVAFIGEPDEPTRLELVRMLNKAGVKRVSAHSELPIIVDLIGQMSPDLIMVADDLDPKVFEFIRDVRHNKAGSNPFVLITTLVAPAHVDAVKLAMQAGADDIIIKPVKEEQLLQRLKRLMMNRAAFVVTSDYLGPDRRPKNRPSAIRRINVLNTMLDKVSGKEVEAGDIQQAVDGAMDDVLQARLDSHGLRMGFVCKLVLEAYKNNTITPDVEVKLRALVGVLKDAAKTAERLEDLQLSVLCGSLSSDVASIADRYMTPTEKDIGLIEKLSRAVVSAVKPGTAPEKLVEENRQAAETYQQRERADFTETQEIQRSPFEPPVEPVDEQVIEILPLAKGQFLFRQGDPATSAYILNNGAIAIFREVDGKRQPIARVKAGELFGEMAIIDGRPRRNSAMALEDCTLSLVAKDMIEGKLAASDALVRMLLQMLSNSMRVVHDTYRPKGRTILDAAREMNEQARYIQSQIESGSPERRAAGAAAAQTLAEIAGAVLAQVEGAPGLDRRTPAMPSQKEMAG